MHMYRIPVTILYRIPLTGNHRSNFLIWNFSISAINLIRPQTGWDVIIQTLAASSLARNINTQIVPQPAKLPAVTFALSVHILSIPWPDEMGQAIHTLQMQAFSFHWLSAFMKEAYSSHNIWRQLSAITSSLLIKFVAQHLPVLLSPSLSLYTHN